MKDVSEMPFRSFALLWSQFQWCIPVRLFSAHISDKFCAAQGPRVGVRLRAPLGRLECRAQQAGAEVFPAFLHHLRVSRGRGVGQPLPTCRQELEHGSGHRGKKEITFTE